MRHRIPTGLLAALALAAAAAAATASPQDGGAGMEGGPAPAGDAPKPQRPPDGGSTEDVLVLKDGREVKGRITAEDERAYAVKVGGAVRVVEKSTVQEVRRATIAAPVPGGDAPPADDGKGGKGGKGEKERKRLLRGLEGGGPGEPGDMPGASPPPLSEEARTWARFCIDRLLMEDPAVQRSAAEALRALGPSVLPVLKEASATADERGRKMLERVSYAVSNPPMPPRPGKGPGQDKPGFGPGPDGKGRPMGLLERVRSELALDEPQSRTVGAALLDFGREVRETMMDARDGLITYEEARSKGGELRRSLHEAVKGSLSEEQLAKLDGILDEMAKRMGGGPPPGAPGKAPPPGQPKDGAPPGPPPKDGQPK
jgi:hypothetical protein